MARHTAGAALALAMLVAAGLVASPAAAQQPLAAGQIAGDVPAGGGYALVGWGGGTVEQLAQAASARGCAVRSLWVTEGGRFLGYVPGAPALVNRAFLERFAGGAMPAGPAVVVCGPSASNAVVGTGGCPLFPDDNPWRTDVSRYPVHPNSDRYIAYILGSGGNRFLHADFGENPEYGIPYVVVPPDQPRVPVEFEYADESDPGPYPIPPDAPVEGGSDRHVIVLQQGTCRLYELFAARYVGSGWQAGSGAVFDLLSNALRPNGWTSADAAGLPIFPGLVRYDEVQSGRITHALRFTVSRTQRGYVQPATHFASSITDPSAPPMGLRLRLRADFDTSRYRGSARVILEALKQYGMFVADNGSNWFISGTSHPGWDDDDLNQLKTVPGTAFEVVDTGPVITRR